MPDFQIPKGEGLPPVNVPSGKLSDRIGRKPLIVAGMATIAVGDFLTGSCAGLQLKGQVLFLRCKQMNLTLDFFVYWRTTIFFFF